jgi:D-alanyl-D-alanine carboxypeptidase
MLDGSGQAHGDLLTARSHRPAGGDVAASAGGGVSVSRLAGVDGTLAGRLRPRTLGHIEAKTGTLRHTSSLAVAEPTSGAARLRDRRELRDRPRRRGAAAIDAVAAAIVGP